ncbi:LysR family transcriptional regulator [Burkholderia multivorans]|uniref:LysR family transcriptional regulator n=1 Tax=Burkholderia multivorans TaxID=87883 RepID=UPI0021C21F93|nr:LysR family transcriptional regulator [Burkholderia multivorans]
MDIRELRSFIHVARAGSFSRAAAELYIAQPALSRQIASSRKKSAWRSSRATAAACV